MRDLGADEEHRSTFGHDATPGSATDALSEIHGVLECFGRDRDRIGIRRAPRSYRYEATRLLDAFEGRSIHHEVPEDWKGLGTPRFNRDLVTVIEMAHMELANGAALFDGRERPR